MNVALPLYVDPNGNLLRRRGFSDKYTASTKLLLKRGVTYDVSVLFVGADYTTAVDQPAGTKVQFILKPSGKFETDTVLATATSANTPSAGNPYTATLTVASAELDETLLSDGNLTNDLVSIDTELEVAWTSNNWATKGATVDRILCTVNNDVRRGTEGSPSASPSPDDQWVAHGHAQSLTEPQKTQFWENVGGEPNPDAKTISGNPVVATYAVGTMSFLGGVVQISLTSKTIGASSNGTIISVAAVDPTAYHSTLLDVGGGEYEITLAGRGMLSNANTMLHNNVGSPVDLYGLQIVESMFGVFYCSSQTETPSDGDWTLAHNNDTSWILTFIDSINGNAYWYCEGTGDSPPLGVQTWTPDGDNQGFPQFSFGNGGAYSIIGALSKTESPVTAVLTLGDPLVSLTAGVSASLSGGANVSPTIDYIGQWLRCGTVAPYKWYQADTLTSWLEQSNSVQKTSPTDSDQIEMQEGTTPNQKKYVTLLNILNNWLKSKGITWSGAQVWSNASCSFTSTTRPTSSGTGTPASASLITRADGDARFCRSTVAVATSNQDVTNSATPVASTQCVVTIPEAGTYFIETSEQIISSAWATAGIKSQLIYTGTVTGGDFCGQQSTAAAASFVNQAFTENNNWIHSQVISAPNHSLWIKRCGRVVFTTAGSVAIGFSQNTAVSGQYARLQPRSFIRATKIS